MEETTGTAFSATKRFELKEVTAVKVENVVCYSRAKEANSPHSGRSDTFFSLLSLVTFQYGWEQSV